MHSSNIYIARLGLYNQLTT